METGTTLAENLRINRIRLEFKDYNCSLRLLQIVPGLIESDWNLKQQKNRRILRTIVGLIESDWNLKTASAATNTSASSD